MLPDILQWLRRGAQNLPTPTTNQEPSYNLPAPLAPQPIDLTPIPNNNTIVEPNNTPFTQSSIGAGTNLISPQIPKPISTPEPSLQNLASELGTTPSGAYRRVTEAQQNVAGRGIQSQLAQAGDIISGIGYAGLETLAAPVQLALGIEPYKLTKQAFGGVIDNTVRESNQQKLNRYEELAGKEVIKRQESQLNDIYGKINNVGDSVVNDLLKNAANEQQASNIRERWAQISSEAQLELGPNIQQLYAVADMHELNGDIERANQIRNVADHNIRAVVQGQLELGLMSSEIEQEKGIGQGKARKFLTEKLRNEFGTNRNGYILGKMLKLDGTPVNELNSRELFTYQDLINDQGTEAMQDLDYEADRDIQGLRGWTTNAVGRVFSRPASRFIGTSLPTASYILEGFVDDITASGDRDGDDPFFTWGPSLPNTRERISDALFARPDSFASSDLGANLGGVTVSDRKRGLGDLSNEFVTKVGDVLPEILTTLLTGRVIPMNIQNIKNGLTAIKGLQGGLTASRAGIIKQAGANLGLGTLYSGFFDAMIESRNQLPGSDENIIANSMGAIVGSIADIWKLAKRAKTVSRGDITNLVRQSAEANKAIEISKSENIGLNEALVKSKQMTDEELVGTKINPEYIESLVNAYESAFKINDDMYRSLRSQQVSYEQEALKLDNQIKNSPAGSNTGDLTIKRDNAIANAQEMKIKADQAQKAYVESVSATGGLKRFIMNNDREGAIEYAQNMKNVLQNSNNPNVILDAIGNLDSNSRAVLGEEISKIIPTDGGVKLRQAESLDFHPEVLYDSVGIDKILKTAESNPQTLGFLGERTVDGGLRHFNRLDGEKYILNSDGLKRLNITENEDRLLLYRNMGSSNSNQDTFLSTMEKKITPSDLVRIRDGNIYNNLLGEINKFIPCI